MTAALIAALVVALGCVYGEWRIGSIRQRTIEAQERTIEALERRLFQASWPAPPLDR